MIETNQLNLDLGEVRLGDERLFEVKILNTYPSAKTVITQFSCGACTHLVGAPDVVPPSHEGVFRFKFIPTAQGEQVKSIFFNIDGNREATFLFRANVTA